jgi:hypothetical protein
MREFKEPFSLKAKNVTSASLKAKICGKVYNIPLVIGNGTGSAEGNALLTLPQDSPVLAKGVYQMHIKADCGCFTLKTYVDCPAPKDHTSVYTPTTTNGGATIGQPIPSC